ncbi:Hcp family type VI secretion system effector [Pseudomonas synxantha]|uniref:Type VI secretion system tube protein Hcp n=2 Tax=Pseudomonas synxantha TaxID=47883 RepID=A0ABS0UTY3_9PSED|nr:type VI secretion system tube protein Hcp [Pseudomonas synxantha]MBI6567737.1 type VI secretion system tube protein Hcp [Pseudomonas synxantha]MBI6583667.1 type VI secretion system tube protein Hcp [Pseudomonas synxantha]MBI6646308.1 type VI secretion system tube protein Hcp [Pseudomonas synxantha]
MAFDAFMHLDGVEGESLDAEHKGWVELLSYHYDAIQSISQSTHSNGGASAGRVMLGDFQISKYVDRATPKLFELCCRGSQIKTVTIRIHRAGGEKSKYMDIVLEDVLVSTVSGQGADQGGLPMEVINLNYRRIKFEYTQQRRSEGASAGKISGGWDRATDKPFA